MYHLFVLMICILAEGGGIPRGCEAKGFAKIVREPVAPVAPVGKLDMGQQVTVVRFWVPVTNSRRYLRYVSCGAKALPYFKR